MTTVITYFARGDASGCGQEGQERCSDLSVKYTFDTHSSASSFYPIILRASGIQEGRPFRGNYRLVFDEKSQKYSMPENMPDEIKPAAPRVRIDVGVAKLVLFGFIKQAAGFAQNLRNFAQALAAICSEHCFLFQFLSPKIYKGNGGEITPRPVSVEGLRFTATLICVTEDSENIFLVGFKRCYAGINRGLD